MKFVATGAEKERRILRTSGNRLAMLLRESDHLVIEFHNDSCLLCCGCQRLLDIGPDWP